MVFELSKFDVMEHLWSTMEKTEDGKHIRYQLLDIEQLWWMGFVDTGRVGMDEWREVFEPHRQADGSFLLTKDAFSSLDAYRYKGEIRVPFDAMGINEGKYTDEGLGDLFDASVAPSCSLSQDGLNKFLEDLKKEFRQPGGLILIKRPAKEKISALIAQYPSPLHNLEILFDNLLRARGEEIDGEIEQAAADTATAQAAIAASHFSSSPTSAVEAGAKEFDAIAKTRKKKSAAEIEGVSKVELKKIKRSRKGMRG